MLRRAQGAPHRGPAPSGISPEIAGEPLPCTPHVAGKDRASFVAGRCFIQLCWYARQESNLRHPDSKSDALSS